MNSLIYLRECQTPSRWHSFRMLSRTFPSSALLKHWMNTLLPPLGMGHSLSSITHPTTTSSSMHVLGMMPPTHQTPSKRQNVYAASGPQDFTIVDETHETQFSQDIDTPSDDFYQVHQTKHNKKLSKPLSGFQRDHAKKTTPSAPKKPFKKYDGPVYVPADVYKLLSPEAVVALKKYNNEAINKFANNRGIHVTDIADHELHPSEDTTPEEQPPSGRHEQCLTSL